jgi:undecaprenyl diphosphate synthase
MSGLHVGIIMDGNGRWAEARGKSRWRGHLAGVDSVREVVRAAPDLGVTTLTLYAFSGDNWKRPQSEVGRLFWLLQEYCQKEADELVASGVRVSHLGRRDRMPRGAQLALERVAQATASGTRVHLRLAIDYGARWAITGAVQKIVRRALEVSPQAAEVDVEDLHRHVCGGTPSADLIIRTAGEQRLSDFLLWEAAYAELLFTPVMWPDFRGEHFAQAIRDFHGRERRFGGLGPLASSY